MSVGQLAAGELDLVIRVPPAEGPGLAGVAGLKQLNVPGVGIFNINFNNTNTDKALRQAIAYAINRPETIEKVLGGLATLNYTIPPGFKVYDDINKYEFNLDKGKANLATSKWDKSKTFRLALLADDPNFTVTAPALQQYIEALGLKVELTALPTAPYTDLIQKSNDFEAFLSFGGSEGVGWYQSSIYFDCAGLGKSQLKLPDGSVHLQRSVRGGFGRDRRRAGHDPAQARPRPQREPARDLPLAAQLPARLFGQARRWLRHLPERARVVPEDPRLDVFAVNATTPEREPAPIGRILTIAEEVRWAPISFDAS